MTDGSAEDRRLLMLVRCVYAVFFVSGALGLIYEVLWLRKLLLVFGTTVHATSTVLTVFFGGLALGSWLFGRLIDRHPASGLLWYAALEALIGLYAFLTPVLFRAVEQVYIPLYRASGFSPAVLVGASFACSAAILLIPTVCMGGTFPILSRFLIRAAEERGTKIASLYGINTLGAMAGTLFVYYVALQRLGWLGTLQCAGLLNLLLGVLARAMNRNLSALGFRLHGEAATSSSAPRPVAAALSADARWLMVAFGFSGFSAMVYEVAWTRSLSLVLGSSIYAFCIMLAMFLGGIAFGSFLARLYLRRHPAQIVHVMALEVYLAAYGLCSIPLFGWLPDWFVALWPFFGHSFAGLSWLQVILSLAVMALPTVWMGLLFPLVSALVTEQMGELGGRIGRVYAVNTVGGILGSFLCGFWLIPSLGIARTLVIAALVNLVAGLLLYVRCGSLSLGRRVAVAMVAFLAYAGLGQWVFIPSWQREALAAGVYLSPGSYKKASVSKTEAQHELLFYRESLNTTVSVHRQKQDQQLFLKVGGKTDASTGLDMGTQVLLAHLPLLAHPTAKRVLVIGLGSGVTLGSVGRYPVSVLHCAELDPAVVEGARYFSDYNAHVHEDPRVRIFVADGRNFLLASQEQYDVIISEPSNPWMAGVANLFTAEFYQLAKQRLAPEGLMCQWFHLYRMFPADVKLVAKTFQEVFPYVSIWSTIPGDVVLMGSQQPHQLDYERLLADVARPEIQQDLARISQGHPRALLEFFWLGPEQVRQLVADLTWIHQDDLPSIEFHAPRALYLDPTFETNYGGLAQLKAPASAISPNIPPDAEDATFYFALGEAYRYRREPLKAIEAFEQTVKRDPSSRVAYLALSELYAKRGLAFKTDDTLKEVERLTPESSEPYQLRARLLWRQGKLEDALTLYEQAARFTVPDGLLAEEIGHALQHMKRPLEAVEYFRSARSQDNQDRTELIIFFAGALKDVQQWREAEHLLTSAIDRHAREPAVPLLLAQVLQAQGRVEEAKAWFEQVLKMAPKPDAYIGLGEIALGRGDVVQATRWLKTGLRYDPYNVKALKTLQEIQQHHG